LLEEVQQLPSHKGLFTVITPDKRGCQLSLLFHKQGKDVFNFLSENGVIADWREPDVIRIAPTPLYNSFTDVYRFANIIKQFSPQ